MEKHKGEKTKILTSFFPDDYEIFWVIIFAYLIVCVCVWKKNAFPWGSTYVIYHVIIIC